MSKPTPPPPGAPAPAHCPQGRGGLADGILLPQSGQRDAARVTAALVVLLSLATLLTGSGWGLAVIAAGFWLRVLFGPRISPFAQHPSRC